MQYTVHSVTGEDDQRWPWSRSTPEQYRCASATSAHPLLLSAHHVHTINCNKKPIPQWAVFIVQWQMRWAFKTILALNILAILIHSAQVLSHHSQFRRQSYVDPGNVSFRHHSRQWELLSLNDTGFFQSKHFDIVYSHIKLYFICFTF